MDYALLGGLTILIFAPVTWGVLLLSVFGWWCTNGHWRTWWVWPTISLSIFVGGFVLYITQQ